MSREKLKKIVYLIGDLGLGGQERQLYYLLRKSEPQDFKILLFVWDFDTSDHYFNLLPDHIKVIGFKPKLNSYFKLISYCFHIILYQPHIIHSYASYLNRVAAFGTQLTVRGRSIGALRSSFRFMLSKYPPQLMKQNYLNPDAIHVNSLKSAGELKEYMDQNDHSAPIHIIPNGLDTLLFYPKSTKSDLSNTLQTIGVGRMIDTKEYQDQILLIRYLKDKGLNVKHIIIGYGPEEEPTRKLIEELDLTAEVVIDNNANDIPGAYREADIFIQTSSTEGLPNCVLEAMSCGLCCIATNVGDTGRLISSGENGYLFNVHDISGMSEKIIQLWNLQNRDKFLSICLSAVQTVQDNFSLTQNYLEIKAMYNSLYNT